jgi:hypothetical protein
MSSKEMELKPTIDMVLAMMMNKFTAKICSKLNKFSMILLRPEVRESIFTALLE